jgi:hypothetical protein
MLDIKLDGLDDIHRLQRKIEELEGTHQIPFDELYPPNFMIAFTDFASIDEMFAASGFKTETEEDFAAIPDDAWDEFIARRTRFASWQAMQEEAGQEWAERRLAER